MLNTLLQWQLTEPTLFPFYYPTRFFLVFFFTLTGYNQTVKNVTFPTAINLRWNFQVIKTQTVKEMNHC